VTKAERKELEKAEKLTEEGKLEEAISALEILQTSADAEIRDLALNYLADAFAAAGRNADAESTLRRSIEERGAENEGLAWQLAVLAPVVRRQGRSDEAEQLYMRALDGMQPDEVALKAITMRNLAYLYWSTGQADKARAVRDSIHKRDPRYEEFLNGVMKPYIEPEIPL